MVELGTDILIMFVMSSVHLCVNLNGQQQKYMNKNNKYDENFRRVIESLRRIYRERKKSKTIIWK